MKKIKASDQLLVGEYIRRLKKIKELQRLQDIDSTFLKARYPKGVHVGGGVVLELFTQVREYADNDKLKAAKLWKKFSRKVRCDMLSAGFLRIKKMSRDRRLYAKFANDKTFKPVDWRQGKQVGNLIYATLFTLDEAKRLNPEAQFELRKIEGEGL